MIDLTKLGVGGYALSWFTLALFVAGIAQGKNRSGLTWFILSAIFSAPIAMFVLVVICDKPPYKGSSQE